MMTREDFVLVADALKDAHALECISLEDVGTISYILADVFEDRNPRFNREKFLSHVGVADL